MAKTEHRERGHHPNSPSNYCNWELRALFTNRGGTSDAAERGTHRHEGFEKGIADRNKENGWNEDGTKRSTG